MTRLEPPTVAAFVIVISSAMVKLPARIGSLKAMSKLTALSFVPVNEPLDTALRVMTTVGKVLSIVKVFETALADI